MDIDFKKEVGKAWGRIRSEIKWTPLQHSSFLSAIANAEVFLKWESEQRTGSFKFRGALNKVRSLSAAEKERGVVSASTGNHGLGISLAARMEGLRLTLILPQTVSPDKKIRLESAEAEIAIYGESCEKAESWARQLAADTGRAFISPYNDAEVIAGQGTVGSEISVDLPEVDVVIVPVGGGGLISGVAGYLKSVRPDVRVYGVEPENSAFMRASLKAGRIVEIAEKESIADAVAGGIEPGSITFPLCRDLVDGILLAEETLIRKSMGLLRAKHEKIVEGAGALPVAALLKDPTRFRGQKVALVISGRNISPAAFERAVRSI
ncbi:MAG: pyridoxal-phosphate dependent enzyme [Acidobacteriota bacterium]